MNRWRLPPKKPLLRFQSCSQVGTTVKQLWDCEPAAAGFSDETLTTGHELLLARRLWMLQLLKWLVWFQYELKVACLTRVHTLHMHAHMLDTHPGEEPWARAGDSAMRGCLEAWAHAGDSAMSAC
eukprot:365297-Chlamydomonas_euryale.AAC.14